MWCPRTESGGPWEAFEAAGKQGKAQSKGTDVAATSDDGLRRRNKKSGNFVRNASHAKKKRALGRRPVQWSPG